MSSSIRTIDGVHPHLYTGDVAVDNDTVIAESSHVTSSALQVLVHQQPPASDNQTVKFQAIEITEKANELVPELHQNIDLSTPEKVDQFKSMVDKHTSNLTSKIKDEKNELVYQREKNKYLLKRNIVLLVAAAVIFVCCLALIGTGVGALAVSSAAAAAAAAVTITAASTQAAIWAANMAGVGALFGAVLLGIFGGAGVLAGGIFSLSIFSSMIGDKVRNIKLLKQQIDEKQRTLEHMLDVVNKGISYQPANANRNIYHEAEVKINEAKKEKSLVYIKIGSSSEPSVSCSQENLISKSRFFQAMLADSSSGFSDVKKFQLGEIQHKAIDLSETFKDVAEEDLKSLFDHLNGKSIKIDEENVWALIDLAGFFGVDSLAKECGNYFINHSTITAETFFDVLNASGNIPSLRLMCIDFLQKNPDFEFANPETDDLDSIVENTRIKNEFKEIKKLIDQIGPQIAIEGPTLIFKKDYTENAIKALKEIDECLKTLVDPNLSLEHPNLSLKPMEISSLVLEETKQDGWDILMEFIKSHSDEIQQLDLGAATTIDDAKLNELAESLNNLDSFLIKGAPITEIPAKIANRITNLACLDCTSLASLNVPKAVNIYCWGCTNMLAITAPEARKICAWNCNKLKDNQLKLNEATMLFSKI
jgi:hypothetical protein